MLRSTFMALGVMVFLLGTECLVVDAAIVHESILRHLPMIPTQDAVAVGQGLRQVQTQEWMPWGFMVTGIIVVLYSIHLPRRFQSV